MEKLPFSVYRDAQRYEEIVNCCWKLCELLEESFLDYENEISHLTSLASEFEKMFDDMFADRYHEC